MPKQKIKINEERCKGCAVCIQFCPLKLLSINPQKINHAGYNVVCINELDKCIGCGMCAMMCPDQALKMKENK
jgi:2-oxoglutarate ferredoxin oxidoreductase subunit delta